MVFYEFRDNSALEDKWVFAVRCHPKSHVVDWQCPDCGRVAEYPSGAFDVTVEGGSAFPDFLGCGAYPLLIVSERVVAAWRKLGVDSFRIFPVGIAEFESTSARRDAAPKYFRVQIAGECKVDFIQTGISISGVCPRCGEIDRDPPTTQPFKLLNGSWDGSPLFRDNQFFPAVSFCTPEVKDVLQAEHLTNVCFERMG